jgi:hypothetical protein
MARRTFVYRAMTMPGEPRGLAGTTRRQCYTKAALDARRGLTSRIFRRNILLDARAWELVGTVQAAAEDSEERKVAEQLGRAIIKAFAAVWQGEK